ncbi:MAG: methyltransferase domain-containing protein [Hyphomicrobiales bacterium]|nr:methyltransferase domain-containing protein [Hyphomicrobiales bacterium]
MHMDVVDLRSFYASPLGLFAERALSRYLRTRWQNCAGLSVLGLGYAVPFIGQFREEAVRVAAFMPAEQGVVNWPAEGASSTALVDGGAIPLPDSCIDRVLLVHALEATEHPREMLSEIWRILTPGGRLVLIAPNRTGLWSRVDATPFGHGQPFSRGQLRDLMRETMFSPVHWGEALYGPPFARRLFLELAPLLEKMGAQFSLPGAGVLVVEATKQLYRPVAARRRARLPLPELAPAPLPAPATRVKDQP